MWVNKPESVTEGAKKKHTKDNFINRFAGKNEFDQIVSTPQPKRAALSARLWVDKQQRNEKSGEKIELLFFEYVKRQAFDNVVENKRKAFFGVFSAVSLPLYCCCLSAKPSRKKIRILGTVCRGYYEMCVGLVGECGSFRLYE